MAGEHSRKSLCSSKDTATSNPFSRVKDGGSLGKGGGFMKKSWSTDSLSLLASSGLGKSSCVCAPTKHEGSFRCRLHRGRQLSEADDHTAPRFVLPKSAFLSQPQDNKI